MSRRSRTKFDEIMRFKESWSARIAKKDSDYQDYAGSSLEDALRLAKVDTMLFMFGAKHPLTPMLKLMRLYLIQKKKAVFCSVGMNEVSVLGALGAGGTKIDRTARVFSQDKP